MSTTRTPSVDKQDSGSGLQRRPWRHAAKMGESRKGRCPKLGASGRDSLWPILSAAKADDLTASAGVGIQGLGDKLSKNAPHAGVLGSVSQSVADTVKEGGEYMEDAKLSGMTGDVVRLIRRYPIPAAIIGIGLGCSRGGN